MKITVNGITKEFTVGNTYRDAAKAFQKPGEPDILLFRFEGHIQELSKFLPDRDITLEPVTICDKEGLTAYQHSAVFLMLKACYEEFSQEEKKRVVVDFSIDNGFYCFIDGIDTFTGEMAERIEKRMTALSQAALPFKKTSMRVEDARELFRQQGMFSKDKLFRYRRSSRVNVYMLDGYYDYFYGTMLDNTEQIRLFRVDPFASGFVLVLPDSKSPLAIRKMEALPKLFDMLSESSDWSRRMELGTVGELNDMITKRGGDEMILMMEAVFEKTIGSIAARIHNEKKRVVLIAGPSSSGKTSFSRRLSIQLRALGYQTHAISVDNYFVDRNETPRNEKGEYDFEALECVDLKLFNSQMAALLKGETIEMPRFNFLSGKKEYRGDHLKLGDRDILVIEGIHCLNDRMSEGFPADDKFRIYVSALTPINIDDHNRVPTTDCRLIRRIVRDNRTRGNSAKDTIAMWGNVRKGEEKNIFPTQESGDIMVNTSMLYEIPVLKVFAEPLLFQIREDEPEYPEATRLLKFLDYFLPLSPESIPKNSLIREFIGGSCLDVG